MKDAYYFPHDSNASTDEKILQLRAIYGWEGYGLFWALIEKLRDTEFYQYSSIAKAGLSVCLNIDKAKLDKFISDCIELGLLVENNGCFYSESLKKRMQIFEEKRAKYQEAGRKGGIAKASLKQSKSIALASKVNKSKVKESKEDIYIPTLKEFSDYIIENERTCSLKSIELKYKSWVENGWKDGNNSKIINWKTRALNIIQYLEKVKVNTETKQPLFR